MAPALVEKIKVLADFGFAGHEPVQVGGTSLAPRDLMVAADEQARTDDRIVPGAAGERATQLDERDCH